MVEETGLEPARSNEQQILSLWRLPITPLLHKSVFGQGATPWIYLLPANQAGSAHDITEPTKELRFYLVLLTFYL